MQYASSVTRSGIQTFARYRNVKSGTIVPSVVTGGYLTQDSTYYYRTFNASGSFVVAASTLVADILTVAGGGGGASGGGGAGGLVYSSSISLVPGTYTITVGGGGAGTAGPSGTSVNGSNSVFGAISNAVGGGHGGPNDSLSGATSGGSGGGGGSTSTTQTNGGAGTAGQGFAGGTVTSSYYASPYPSAGGGGAGAVGSTPTGASTAGAGGVGSLYFGNYYAGGGGGAVYGGGTHGAGGTGGGGAGAVANGTPGTTNTGGGGGACGSTGPSGSGGSGTVIVRFLKSSVVASNIWQSDAYSAYLKVATPFASVLGISDYSATISGTGSNRVMTAVNSPTISTGATKFYDSSLSTGVFSDNRYISTPTNANLQIGTNDFTIEGWFYFTTVSAGYQALASHAGDTGDSQPGWILITETNNYLNFYSATAAGGWSTNVGSTTAPTLNAWSHIAVSRSGSTLRMFLNGTQIGINSSATGSIGVPSSQTLRIGHYNWFPGGARGISGYVQDFRFYVGAAKYTGAFTPPAQMYVG